MELSAYALERKNVRMLNFACLAASLLLTAGVGAGYVSTPSRHNAPQYVDGVRYCGFDSSLLSDLNLSVLRQSPDSAGSNELYLPSYAYFDPISFGSEITQFELNDVDAGCYILRYDLYYGVGFEFNGYYTWSTLDEGNFPLNVCILSDDSILDGFAIDVSLLYGIPMYDGDLLVGAGYLISFNLNSLYTIPTWVAGNALSPDSILTYSPSYSGTDVTDAITDGLGAIVPMGGALVTGFDAIALDDGALTPVVTFGFVLMGLGISVGIVKKCFNWVTGRHGM